MRRGLARIVDHRRIHGNVWATWFQAPELALGAEIGQFLMVHTPAAWDTFWPRAFSYHRFRPDPAGSRQFALLYKTAGRGTSWLAERSPGEELEAFGPLGHGFRLRPGSQQLLLVAGGIGIAPLVGLAEQEAEHGRSLTLLMGARTADDLYPAELLHPAVEYLVTTEDGSAGQKGLVTDLFARHMDWADQVFACGPNPMFKAMAGIVRRSRPRLPVQVLLEENMACGTGVCYGCAVETRRGMQLVCKDGPRFDLRQLLW